MNRSNYFDYIEERLSTLIFRIKQRGKINLLNLNIHSENFFADFFNLIFNYNLKNMNTIKQNSEAIDLIDKDNKVIIQVSSNCSKTKLNNTLKLLSKENYNGYHFLFIALTNETPQLNSHTYSIPSNISFSLQNDIFDLTHILKIILTLDIDHLKPIYDFIKKNLGLEIDICKIDSNLASIINILSKVDLSKVNEQPEINLFEIQNKIIYNNLEDVKDTIDEYVIYCKKLDSIYKEFDIQGKNKSLSVLNLIKTQYVKLSPQFASPSQLFFHIIDAIIAIIQSSKNYIELPYEELELAVNIIVVDAFVRCKIFKNPVGYLYATTK